MIVLVDSTALIYLAAIGKFDLLQALYGQVSIPTAVFDEVVNKGVGRWGASETAGATWTDKVAVSSRGKVLNLRPSLHGGESEVVVLAEEMNADLVIMDELAARKELIQRGIPFVGTVGVLMHAKRCGLINLLEPELDQLRAAGFHLSDRVYQNALRLVGE